MKHNSTTFILSAILVGLGASDIRAVEVLYDFDFEITSTSESGGFSGSTYNLRFLVDYTALDSDATNQFVSIGSSFYNRLHGLYAGSISMAELSLVSGPYDPSGGTIPIGEIRTIVSTVPGEPDNRVNFNLNGLSGFPEISPGRPLETISIFASDDFDPTLDLNDTGSGQTLMATTGDVIDLGDQSGNPLAVSLDFGGTISRGQIISATVSVIPEPCSLALIVFGALAYCPRRCFCICRRN